MKRPAELAAEMQALQEAIDGFNDAVRAALMGYAAARETLMQRGTELGFSARHMQGWLARIPKQDVAEQQPPIALATGLSPNGGHGGSVEPDLTLPASLKR